MRILLGTLCLWMLANHLIAETPDKLQAVSVQLPAFPVMPLRVGPAEPDNVSDLWTTFTAGGGFGVAASSAGYRVQELTFGLQKVVVEGKSGKAVLKLKYPEKQTLVFSIQARPAKLARVPKTVKIPAGKTTCEFDFAVSNDNLVNLSRNLRLNVFINDYLLVGNSMLVSDDEAVPKMTIKLPYSLDEAGSPGLGRIQLDRAADVKFKVRLRDSTAGELNYPRFITVGAGDRKAEFTVRALNNGRIDGTIPISITGEAEGLAPAVGRSQVKDNEKRELLLKLPEVANEGGDVSGVVAIPGTLPSDLIVKLTSTNPDRVLLPETVTIPAGSTSASFAISGKENEIREGGRKVEISVSEATFSGDSEATMVRDNEPASYEFLAIPALVDATGLASIQIRGGDIDGNLIAHLGASVEWSIVLPDGSTLPTVPTTLTGGGTANVKAGLDLHAVQTTSLRLRVSGAGNAAGDSNAFSIMRAFHAGARDLVWDSNRNCIYASLPFTTAGSVPGGPAVVTHKVVAIDPTTLEITGQTIVDSAPGKLALTSNGEALYVALDGNGSISRISLPDFTVVSTFPVGVDPLQGKMFAEDLGCVEGQPDLLVVSQSAKDIVARHAGVAVYENGTARAERTPPSPYGVFQLEHSPDPSIFYGFGFGSDIRRFKVGPNGINPLGVPQYITVGDKSDIRADDDVIFSSEGIVINGKEGVQVGQFPVYGLVCPEVATNRAYFLESSSSYDSNRIAISAYDSNSFTLLGRLAFPAKMNAERNLIRFGDSGLAFMSSDKIVLLNSGLLVPGSPPADLEITVKADPDMVDQGSPAAFTVKVVNKGTNPALRASVVAQLSKAEIVTGLSATRGQPSVSGSVVSWSLDEIPAGGSEDLSIKILPDSLGLITCSAAANSTSKDPNPLNNKARDRVRVKFKSGMDIIHEVDVTANNFLYDPTRGLIWASVSETGQESLRKCVVSIDPMTGLVSDPIPIGGNPAEDCMAISKNGRYLYVGIMSGPEIRRFDLDHPEQGAKRIGLNLQQWNTGLPRPFHIEALDSNESSFVVLSSDWSIAAYDDDVMRPNRIWLVYPDSFSKDVTADRFLVMDGFDVTRFEVNAAGVNDLGSNRFFNGGSGAIGGGFILMNDGGLWDSQTLEKRANFGFSGYPFLDVGNQRGYQNGYSSLRAYDLPTGKTVGQFTLPSSVYGTKCIRWGTDGFAFGGWANKIRFLRWSLLGGDVPGNAIAARGMTSSAGGSTDSDGDGIPDGIEYLYGTSPSVGSRNSMELKRVHVGVEDIIQITFSRRLGIDRSEYDYQISSDLTHWNSPEEVVESVLSRENREGVEIEHIEARIRVPNGKSCYVRLGVQQSAVLK